MYNNQIDEAFEILLDEIESVINELKEVGVEAVRSGNYRDAKLAIERTARLKDFQKKVKTLQRELAGLFVRRIRTKQKYTTGKRRQTPEEAFRRPILEALEELGGSAKAAEVLKQVKQKMKNVLTTYDRQKLSSGSVRWQKMAQFCRFRLVQEGLMKSGSPRGIWEISELGRKELKSGKNI